MNSFVFSWLKVWERIFPILHRNTFMIISCHMLNKKLIIIIKINITFSISDSVTANVFSASGSMFLLTVYWLYCLLQITAQFNDNYFYISAHYTWFNNILWYKNTASHMEIEHDMTCSSDSKNAGDWNRMRTQAETPKSFKL